MARNTNATARRASTVFAAMAGLALSHQMVQRAWAADLLEGVMGLLGSALGFAGSIFLGLGLIMLAVQLRFDSAGGQQLMGAIGMLILGVLMIAFQGIV